MDILPHHLTSLGPSVVLGVALGIILTRQAEQARKIEAIIAHLQVPTKKRKRAARLILPPLIAALLALLS